MMSNNAPDYKDNLAFDPNKMQEYKHEYVHYEFDIRGEKFHLMDDEAYNGALLESFNEGVNHGEKELKHSEKMRDLSAEYIQRLEERLESTLSRAIQAENKLSREKLNKDAMVKVLQEVTFWLRSMVSVRCGRYSQCIESNPADKFEQLFLAKADSLDDLIKNIKE